MQHINKISDGIIYSHVKTGLGKYCKYTEYSKGKN